jgi:hypothetical protein
MSRFAEFLSTEKIDPRRILSASRELERFRPEDRALRLKKRNSKSAEGGADAAAKSTEKPRSGRPVTPRLLGLAQDGGAMSGPQKSRILRAVNHLLSQKKREPVDLRKLF